jgi:hypothetical protein
MHLKTLEAAKRLHTNYMNIPSFLQVFYMKFRGTPVRNVKYHVFYVM